MFKKLFKKNIFSWTKTAKFVKVTKQELKKKLFDIEKVEIFNVSVEFENMNPEFMKTLFLMIEFSIFIFKQSEICIKYCSKMVI